MQPITLKPLVHRQSECMGIYFTQHPVLHQIIKSIPGIRWSKTHRCWWMLLNKPNYHLVVKACKNKAVLNINVLSKFLETRKAKEMLSGITIKQGLLPATQKATIPKTAPPPASIYAVNRHIPVTMKQHLVLKAYSASTIKTYLNEMNSFLQTLQQHPAEDFTPQRLKDYLQYCAATLKLSENTLHSRMNALKFYYEQVLKREKFFWEIPRPKKPQQLPKLLNEGEIAKLFNALTNKKRKAILFTAYSAGLRVSEVVNLKIADIDSKRMQILVQRAKGKKDRYVNLSPVLLDILRQYLKDYKPRPTVYLFESEHTHTAYPTRTVQEIFGQAKRKAGIKKEVGIHSLRHSFATHLLDKGTDIRYIKDLLGHFNIKTTERYLHVSKKQLINIVSPFDDLWKKENINW